MNQPVDNANRPLLRMDTGIAVLEEWADGATQRDKNTVYAALFAMTDRTIFRSYRVVDDALRLNEFFVLLGDLVLKMTVHCHDSFGIVYIGPHAGAPGLASALDNDLAA